MVDSEFVRLCPKCENPMIGTFAFRGCELYCVDCGYACGIFGGASSPVMGTPEQLAKRQQDEDNFAPLAPYLSSGRFWRIGCKLCDPGKEPHLHHLTKEEENLRIDARARLERLKRVDSAEEKKAGAATGAGSHDG